MFSVPRSVTSAATDNHYHGHSVRKRKYIDGRLQGVLLFALILLEIGMLVGAMVYLYFQFSATIEANLFTIHRSAQTPLLPTFLKEMGIVMVAMAVINTAALLVANYLWVRHIKRVVGSFRQRLQRVGQLDLSQPSNADEAHHEVLTLLEQWRALESKRALQIDLLLEALPAAGSLDSVNEGVLEQLVEELDVLLQDIR